MNSQQNINLWNDDHGYVVLQDNIKLPQAVCCVVYDMQKQLSNVLMPDTKIDKAGSIRY